jgi:5-bromo-4-chloroindolyl phosphate hydrolysis protein
MAFGLKSQKPDAPKTTKARWFKSWTWTGASFVGSVGVGLLLLTEVRSGPVLATLAGLGAYYLLAFLLPQTLSGRDTKVGGSGQKLVDAQDPRVELLVEAHQHVATLAAARVHMPMSALATLDALHDHAASIIEEVSAQPEKLGPVLRFFTYYLPSTADLAMDRIKLASHAGSQRLAEIDQTLLRLVEAFAGFDAAVRAPDLESVDMDIELLDQALDADLEGLKR